MRKDTRYFFQTWSMAIEDVGDLSVPPFTAFSTRAEIVDFFGGRENMYRRLKICGVRFILCKYEKKPNKQIVIYQGKSGAIELRGDFEHESIYATLDQISAVFGRDKSVISRHLKNIFNGGELARNAVVAKIATTAADGKTYQVEYYNLDAILSVGYRVNSKTATLFRQWGVIM